MSQYDIFIKTEKDNYENITKSYFNSLSDDVVKNVCIELRAQYKSYYLSSSLIYVLCNRDQKDHVRELFQLVINDIMILKVFLTYVFGLYMILIDEITLKHHNTYF